MTQETIEFERPGDIDGEPRQVANQVRDQLLRVAPPIRQLSADSYVQVRSAWMSAAISLTGDELSDEELAERWETSELQRRIARVDSAAQEFLDAVVELQSGPKPPR